MRVSNRIYHWLFGVISVLFMSQTLRADIYRPTTPAELVSAISSANASADDNVIDLEGRIFIFGSADADYTALPKITASGRLSIINGAIERQRVDDTPSFKLIEVGSGAYLSLFNITLTNGYAYDGTGDCLSSNCFGGAIYNAGRLDLENCTLAGNSSYASGGAIFNDFDGVLTVQSSNISNNTAIEGGLGGAIYSAGVIETITNTTIANNEAVGGNGGGIYNAGSLKNLFSSTISGNFASLGGGITNEPAAHLLQITNSTIAGNQTTGIGGGINIETPAIGNRIKDAIPNETVGVYIYNCTISDNTSTSGGGGIYNDGIINELISNIIAGNTDPDSPDVANVGTITIEGYNLIGSGTGNSFADGANYDIVGAEAQLGSLQDNGGFTFTMALLPYSPAINQGNNPYALSFDQRGTPYARVKCGLPDMGAFEWQKCY